MRNLLIVPVILIAASVSGAAYAQSVPGVGAGLPGLPTLAGGKVGGQQGLAPLSEQQLNQQQSDAGAGNPSRGLLNGANPPVQAVATAQAGVTQVQQSPDASSNSGVSQGLAGLQVGLGAMGQAVGRVF